MKTQGIAFGLSHALLHGKTKGMKMGDRATVQIKDSDSSVYFYTHWNGFRLPATVAQALSRKQRWADGPYLARIIFCEMVKGFETDETGYGIAAYNMENEYEPLIVDVDAQTVTMGSKAYSFGEFCAVTSWNG